MWPGVGCPVGGFALGPCSLSNLDSDWVLAGLPDLALPGKRMNVCNNSSTFSLSLGSEVIFNRGCDGDRGF